MSERDVHTRGGSGSLEAHTLDMHAVAGRCEDIGGRVKGAAVGALGESGAVAAVPGSMLSPGTLASTVRTIGEFELRGHAVAAGAWGLSRSLTTAAVAYERTERTLSELPGDLLHGAGIALGIGLRLNVWRAGSPLTGAGVVLAGAAAAPFLIQVAQSDEGLPADWPLVAEHLDHFVPGVLRGLTVLEPDVPGTPLERGRPRDAGDIAELVLLMGRLFGRFERSALTVHESNARVNEARPVEPARDIAELFSRTGQQNKARPEDTGPWLPGEEPPNRRGENGEVSVEEVIQPDGSRAWVVHVPGTTDWGTGRSGTPTDMTSNMEGVAGEESQAMQLVREAMERAGVEPGEEVLLSGFSQGGRTAAALLEDEEFLRRYNVTSLVTVGAPVANSDIPDSVDVLSIQQSDDPVPFIDGGQNPSRANWTTVTVSPPGGADAPPRPLSGTHNSRAYTESIQALQDCGSPALRSFMTRNPAFFSRQGGGSGSAGRKREFYGQREYPEEQGRRDRGNGRAPRREDERTAPGGEE